MAVFLAVFAVAGTFVGGLTGPVVRAESVATNFPVHAEFRPNDPYYLDQWGMQKIGAPNAWDVTLGKPSVVVAVVDTGVWWTRQDIQANMWVNPGDGTTHGYDFISGDTNPMDESSGVYHGTGVAGVIAAIIDNGQDVAGTAQVKVMALRALGLNGQGSSFNTSQAIRWAAQNGAKIINLSLGTNETFGDQRTSNLQSTTHGRGGLSSSPRPETRAPGPWIILRGFRTSSPSPRSTKPASRRPSRISAPDSIWRLRAIASSPSTGTTRSIISRGRRSRRPS